MTPLLIATLWISGGVGAVLFTFSLSVGTAAQWAVLRGVGAFVVFMLIGIVAELIARAGLDRAAREAQFAQPEARPARPSGVLEPDAVTSGDGEE